MAAYLLGDSPSSLVVWLVLIGTTSFWFGAETVFGLYRDIIPRGRILRRAARWLRRRLV